MAKAKASPAKGSAKAENLPPLVIRYPRRMKPQKVYKVEVTWQRGRKYPLPKPGEAEPLTLRLIMAGAQVVPLDRPLDTTKANAKATFYVTPLVKGWLRSERIEVLANGRKVQEIKLPAKVTTQRLGWTLLLLAVLVPWFLLAYVKPNPLHAQLGKAGAGAAVQNAEQQLPPKGAPAVQQPPGPPPGPGGGGKGKKQPGADPDSAASSESKTVSKYEHVKGLPGEGLARFIDQENLVIPDELDKHIPPDVLKAITTQPQDIIGLFYGRLHQLTLHESSGGIRLAPWVGLGFFLLALPAFFFHREKMKRVRGKPIPLSSVRVDSTRANRRISEEAEEVVEAME